MKIEKGSKVTIKNSTDNTISLPIFKHNFRWDMKKDEEITFPIQSVERLCYYLKQKSLGLDVTIGAQVDANQIVVGNTYKQWVIYTNAKMVDEIATYITSIQPETSEESLELVTVGTTPQNRQPPIVITKAENGVVILSIGLEDTHMVYFVALNGGTVSYFPTITEDGWYELEMAGEEFNVTKLDLKDEPYTFNIGDVFLMPVDFISRKFDSLRSSIKGIKEE